jgi:hypothetical protein
VGCIKLFLENSFNFLVYLKIFSYKVIVKGRTKKGKKEGGEDGGKDGEEENGKERKRGEEKEEKKSNDWAAKSQRIWVEQYKQV